MPTCAFVTLGCKVNQYDTQAIREALARRGYREVGADQAADLYVVNTCCVTRRSHRRGLREIRRLARRHPAATLVVTGCSVDAGEDELAAIAGVDRLAPNAQKPMLAALVAGDGGDVAAPPDRWPGIAAFAGHSRAFVKVQDGCESFCSYCIVPRVRGPVRSRPPGEVEEEVGRLVDAGYLEVVLTGIHLGFYGRDSGGRWGLVPLVARVAETPGLRRLRLSSIEIGEVSDELLALMARSPVVCPHLHIPLQSGDDRVLEAMNRRYTARQYLARLDAVRRRLDEPALTTDILVGFPGETEAEFRRTVEVARRAAFSRLHVFPYSDREGTAAFAMGHKVPPAAIDARRREMLGVAAELGTAYHRRFVGRVVEPLVESRRDRRTGLLCGYTPRYVRCLFEGTDALFGRLARVRGRRALARGLRAAAVRA
ncbi:MAG: tRNA (N(6)-L-threonylcarbamoyladenosine(37)-C(2))-methylthiotransferase MtaB [Candidatus Brocadiia bacterium]